MQSRNSLRLNLISNGQAVVTKHLASEAWVPIEIRRNTQRELSIHLNKGFVFHTEGRLEIQRKKLNSLVLRKRRWLNLESRSTLLLLISIQERIVNSRTMLKHCLKKESTSSAIYWIIESNEASVYFEDRRRGQDDEIINVEPIRDTVTRRLSSIKKAIEDKGYPGKFGVFTYKHVPYNYFMIVDGGTPNGSMMVSHYIYGIPRGKCPVWEFYEKPQ